MADEPVSTDAEPEPIEGLGDESRVKPPHPLAISDAVCSGLVPSIQREFCAMLRYALAHGLPVPAGVTAGLAENSDLARLAAAHNELARAVLPATPASILMLAEERSERFHMFGPIRLIRSLVVFAIALLVVFILLSIVTRTISRPSDAQLKLGAPLSDVAVALDTIYLVASAGLGAIFAALFRANRYVANGTFERRYEGSYWILIVLGFIAGLALSLVIPTNDEALTMPLLALLGGFSARAVHQILERLVEAVVALFGSAAADNVDVRERDALVQDVQSERESRIRAAGTLTELQADIAGVIDSQEVREKLKRAIDDLLGKPPPDPV